MKVRLGCQSIRSVHWAVEKVPAQIGMTYDKSRKIVVILKSSFLPKEKKKRISRDYCRNNRPSSIYVYIYIYILGQGLGPRTPSNPMMGKLCHGSPHL